LGAGCHSRLRVRGLEDWAVTYPWEDDAKKGYALWISIMRARLLIVKALKWRAKG
jgi:hypothetical protein